MRTNYVKRVDSARSGFTLIELLVVIVIIGILASILIPAIQHIIFRANVTKCAQNLKGLYTAVTTYCAKFRGLYPTEAGSALWTKLSSPEVDVLSDKEFRKISQCPVQADGLGPDYRGPKKKWSEATNSRNVDYIACDNDGLHGEGNGGNAILKSGAPEELPEGAEWQKALSDTQM